MEEFNGNQVDLDNQVVESPMKAQKILVLYSFIILGWILERWDGVMWTGLVWLRIGTGGELL
jgi:hypothetical protein